MPNLLAVHRDLLGRWRKSMNLIGPGDLEDHYRDADRALGWLQPSGRWVDVGSGAGFPGIPLAAKFPHLEVDLVESRKKRCAFLNRVLAESGTSPDRVRVHCTRVESLPDATWNGMVSRAFAPPPVALAHAARLLVPGGTVLLFLQGDGAVPEQEGFEVFHVERYALDGRERKVVALRWR